MRNSRRLSEIKLSTNDVLLAIRDWYRFSEALDPGEQQEDEEVSCHFMLKCGDRTIPRFEIVIDDDALARRDAVPSSVAGKPRYRIRLDQRFVVDAISV